MRRYEKSLVYPLKSCLWDSLRIPAGALKGGFSAKMPPLHKKSSLSVRHPTIWGVLTKPKPCHCEECGEVMQGVEHDETISICALCDAGALKCRS